MLSTLGAAAPAAPPQISRERERGERREQCRKGGGARESPPFCRRCLWPTSVCGCVCVCVRTTIKHRMTPRMRRTRMQEARIAHYTQRAAARGAISTGQKGPCQPEDAWTLHAGSHGTEHPQVRGPRVHAPRPCASACRHGWHEKRLKQRCSKKTSAATA